MAGTIAGGQAAAATNKLKYGPEFYAKIGSLGGRKKGKASGFAATIRDENGLTGRDRARIYGAVGGRKSKRRKAEV